MSLKNNNTSVQNTNISINGTKKGSLDLLKDTKNDYYIVTSRIINLDLSKNSYRFKDLWLLQT